MTLTALVAASLVGSAQAYACKSDGQCKYPGCEYGACYWWWDGWDYDCRRTPPAADRSYCNDPPPCPPGQYSIGGGKNGGSDYACRSCEAGKFQSSAGASRCDNCLAGKYSVAVGATAVNTCDACGAGKYSTPASAECQLCPAGSFSLALEATSSATCASCDAGTTSVKALFASCPVSLRLYASIYSEH